MVKKKKKSIEIIKKEIILLENNTNKNIEEKQSYLNLIKQILEYQIHNKLNIQKLLKLLKPNNQTIIYWIYKYSKNNNVYKKIINNYHSCCNTNMGSSKKTYYRFPKIPYTFHCMYTNPFQWMRARIAHRGK